MRYQNIKEQISKTSQNKRSINYSPKRESSALATVDQTKSKPIKDIKPITKPKKVGKERRPCLYIYIYMELYI